MNATGPNGPIGMGASPSNGSEGVSFSWDDGVVDEGSYERKENSSHSNWLDGGHLLSDDDDDDEITSIKELGSKQLNEVDENETNGYENARDEVDGNEADGNEEAREENEADLVGLWSGEETKYLDSSDVGSYEIDLDGDVISKKTGQFKDALYAYAVGHRFDFKFVSNKKEKVRVVCKGKGCSFVVHASRDKSDGCFKVKTLVTDHNCSVTFKNSRANYKFVRKHFIRKLRILPILRLVQMIKLGREELNVELNKKLCFRAKKLALEKIRGSVVHEFHRLWDYINALRAADVGGNFDLVVERPNATGTPKFRRIYVRFSALRDCFKMYRRPVVGLDGCFLKGSFKGEILSAVGRDCNNQIFSIAWAVVEVENRETWTWFLNNLQHDLGLGDGDGCTLLSDMQKVENHGPSPTPSAPPSSQTSHVPPSSEMTFVPSSQISSPPSSQTSHFLHLLKYPPHHNRLLQWPLTRSFTKSTSQPTSTTATPPVVVPLSASSEPDATAIVSTKAKLPKLAIKRHPPKN
ncbi:hypothetical protein V6N12_012740 [Hibiscus sabdariffa]|uniref:Transposase MuDR plant domain-containing protein n=1 Tax=Hibiscus sabdariffa TaxID=183260 RepID=A0ABR2DDF7_9ROSI